MVETYRQDFPKYASYSDKRCLNHTLSTIAGNVGHQIKYTKLSDEFSGPTNKKAFELLQMAHVLHKVREASPGSLPPGANASDQRFKALLVELGFLRVFNNLPAHIEFMKNDLLSMYNGALAEQFVGQEMVSSGSDHLYY
ncbi:MAG: hypothetical protein JW861_06710 [Bacteroidales bacterium]|nr:hypothetical protein [Bacteroidales bacterium]